MRFSAARDFAFRSVSADRGELHANVDASSAARDFAFRSVPNGRGDSQEMSHGTRAPAEFS
jgi:hypothetical protein